MRASHLQALDDLREALPFNQPPLWSERFSVVPGPTGGGSVTEAVLRVGRPVQIVLDAKDPDGDALTFAARPLPEGAVLDTQRGVLAWRSDTGSCRERCIS